MTMDEFSGRVLKPSVLTGIRSGRYDAAILVTLQECPPDDPEIFAAMAERLRYLQHCPPPKNPWADIKPGTKLHIRVPTDYTLADGPALSD